LRQLIKWRRRDDVGTIEQQGAQPVIPPRANRQSQWAFEKHLDKDRNLIERFFNRPKQYQWIAMRYDKLVSSYSAFIAFRRLDLVAMNVNTPVY
jgi:transposase